nr:M23 family metallopeptidase [Longirhabdus pacifica]
MEDRKQLFDHMSTVTHIPWYYFAAVDQYERNTSNQKKKREITQTEEYKKRITAIHIPLQAWYGAMNLMQTKQSESNVMLFNGIGRDGDGDGLVDHHNDMDVVTTMASIISKHGTSDSDMMRGLWDYYQNDRIMKRITQLAAIYRHFDMIQLEGNAFPVPLHANYSYRSTWGASRGWGGRRIHEGTDIFANHGVTVRSTSYGIVEEKGWNRFGGWRIGIRDVKGIYHYFAHLNGFEKSLEEGSIVKPGDTIGWVGSSGYGKPGTQGKFPPHLHYGMYKDNGYIDWSFDPYPYLRKWERQERKRR